MSSWHPKKEGGKPWGYYDAAYCTGQPYYDTEESIALWALLTPKNRSGKGG